MNGTKKASDAIAGIITTMIDDLELDQYDDRDHIIRAINRALAESLNDVFTAQQMGKSIEYIAALKEVEG